MRPIRARMEEHAVTKARARSSVNVHRVSRDRNAKSSVSCRHGKNRRFASHRSCLSLAACYNNPCVNNGICEAFNETTYYCKCPAYFTGQRCEITVPGKQRATGEITFLISHRPLCEFLDPCKTKNCGPFGQCRDNQGAGICFCNDGAHLDGSPCLGTVVMVASLDLFRP